MLENWISKILRAPKTVMVFVAFVLVAGIVTYQGLRVDLFPPLNFPVLNVITELSGYSSLEMERQVSLPIESVAGGVLGVTRVRSTSATGISMVSVEFGWGTDILQARQLLMEALSGIQSQLPSSAQPTIENLSATLSEIEGYALKGPADGSGDLVKMRDMAVYDLKPRLQRIPGIYKILVMGGKVMEYRVFPNPLLMIKYDLTLEDIKNSLADNNILSSPGILNHFNQEFVIHTNGQFENEDEISQVVIAMKNGTPVRLKDVAAVTKGFAYERGDTSQEGQPAVLINILKQPNFDTIQIARRVREEIEHFKGSLPGGFTLRNYYDQATLVSDSIRSVKESVLLGGLLVVLVLGAFLHNFRSTLIAALSIPISVTAALILMGAFGVGLNIMSLGGLAIGTGIIVDDTIVVLENIFRWLHSPELRKGLNHVQIVVRATHEVYRPILVSTLTNVAIFLPMIFIAGFAGRLFAPVSLTVAFALLASLVVAVTVIPTLTATWIQENVVSAVAPKPGKAYEFYLGLLKKSLEHPWRVLVLALIPIIAVVFVAQKLDVEFLPSLDEGAVLLQTIMPPGTSLDESRRLGLKLERWLKSVPGVVTVVRRTGHAPGAEDTDNVNHSDITVKLEPKNHRPVSMDELIDALNEQTSKLQGAVINYLMPLADKINDALGGVPADLGIDVFGSDLNELHRTTQKLVAQMEKIPGVSDLRPPLDLPVPSLDVEINKAEAGRLGITGKSIHEALQAFSSGLEATSVREIQKEIGVVIHLSSAKSPLDLESLASLPLKTAGGNTVPLEQVARFRFSDIPSEIYHDHLTRKLTVTCNVRGRQVSDVARQVKVIMDGLNLPAGYSWSFSGKYETESSSLKNLALILFLAIALVSLILWLEFKSVFQTSLILLTIPLAAIGAILSLWTAHQALNVSSMIGAILLVGIVVRNGIMLLDYTNRELALGKDLQAAILSACQKRVRPILMTATVTILGLIPLAIGWGSGSELQKPLAIAVIGGMVTSTLLSLVVLPAATQFLGRKAKEVR